MKDAKNPVKALETSLRLLEEIKTNGPSTITELESSFDISKGTVHNHLSTLQEHGFVVREDGAFSLGVKFFQYGQHVRHSNPLYDSAKAEVDQVASQTGELCNLMIEEHGRGYYFYRAVGDKGINFSENATPEYLHNTASGKAILANLPEKRVREIIDYHGLPARTDQTITDPETLFDELEQIRDNGIAFDVEERAEGVKCLAAPVITDGEPQGAISISGPGSRMDGDYYRRELPKLLRDTANVIEINLSY